MRVRKQTAIARPVARTEGLLVETVGEETVVYDLNTKEAHCLKGLAASVFMYADGSRTASEIAELVAYRLNTPVAESEVADAVGQLESCALLDAGPLLVRNGISRREAVGKFAKLAGVATATPLIATVMAPAASAAGSQLQEGQCCGSSTTTCTGLNSSCASNHCCQNISSKDCNQCKCVNDKNDCSGDKCGGPVGTCQDVTVLVNGVETTIPACGSTSSGRCCFTDPITGTCCTVHPVGNTLLSC